MDKKFMEPAVEKVETGAIVIISGEYIPVAADATSESEPERTFLAFGETAPKADENEWKLVDAFDFSS